MKVGILFGFCLFLVAGCAAGPGFATSLAAVLGGQRQAAAQEPGYYYAEPVARSPEMRCFEWGGMTRCMEGSREVMRCWQWGGMTRCKAE